MKRMIPLLISLLLLTGCGGNTADGAYQQITQEDAKEMMDTQEVIILDVREQAEYDSGHIPGAVLLPVGTIDETTAAEVIPEKDSKVLVYCRSGNRSKTPPRWPTWGTQTSTNSAASTPGRMIRKRKINGIKPTSPIQRIRDWPSWSVPLLI